MLDWIALFIDPSDELARPDVDPRIAAIAHLLLGQIDLYQRGAEQVGLPLVGREVPPGRTAEDGLIHGITGLILGDATAPATLCAVVDDVEATSDVRTVAAVLASIGLSSAARPELGIRVLVSAETVSESPIERRLLQVHRSVRLAECGQYAAALEASSLPGGDIGPLGGRLSAVATRNRWHFSWLAGLGASSVPVPRLTGFPAFGWLTRHVAAGLEALLNSDFESYFQNPYTRTLRFGAQAQSERLLGSALFRAECLADWSQVQAMRVVVGRSRLLREIGKPVNEIEGALWLLVRGRDPGGIELAARTLLASGPITPLRLAGRTAAVAPWRPHEIKSAMKLIRYAASTFDPELADSTIDRLVRLTPAVRDRQAGDLVTHEVLDAVAALLPYATIDAARVVARAALVIAQEPPDALTHQALPAVLISLPWRQLPRDIRGAWLRYLSSELSATTHHVFVAYAAAAALAHAGSRLIWRSVEASYRDHRAPLAVGLLAARSRLPVDIRTAIEADAVERATQLRERASKGDLQMGAPSIGGLLGRMARGLKPSVLRAAVEFALDPNVAQDERIAAASELIHVLHRTPRWVRRALQVGLEPSRVEIVVFGTPVALRAFNLELRARLSAISREDATGEFLDLAHSSSLDGRIGAVNSGPTLREVVGGPIVESTTLGLSWDASPTVRARAGAQLVHMTIETPGLAGAARHRIGEMLSEPGEEVPRACWAALSDSTDSASAVFTHHAENTVANHESYAVRRVAAQFLAVARGQGGRGRG